MQISFESPEKVGGVLTLTVEEGDYKADVEKKLKEYRRRANMPGFRPGQVPMGLIRRQMGNSVEVDIWARRCRSTSPTTNWPSSASR